MIFSEERAMHMAHIIYDEVWGADIADFKDDDQALAATKKAIQLFLLEEKEIDEKARHKIQTLKRGVLEGTREWDILYLKYCEEERGRHGK